jgi:WD40 repeat protein
MRSAPWLLILLLVVSRSRADELPDRALRRFEPVARARGISVRFLGFTPDGKTVLCCGKESGLSRCDVSTGKRTFESLGPRLPVPLSAAALSSEGDITLGIFASYRTFVVTFCSKKVDEIIRDSLNDGVNAVAISPNRKQWASGCDDHTIRIWDRETLDYQTCKGHTAYLSALAFDPSGKLLASGSHDRTIRVWNATTKKQVRLIEGHRDQVSALAFLPDGKTLASASWDRTARLWEMKTGKELRKFEGHRLPLMNLSLSGKTLATGGLDGTARLWDTATGKELRRLNVDPDGVFAVALSPDGKLLATGDDNDTVCLWDTATGRRLHQFPAAERDEGFSQASVHCVALSVDLKRVATGGGDGAVRLWDADTGKHLRRLGRQHDIVWCVAFSPDDKYIASVGRRDGTVHIWDVEKAGEVKRLTGQQGGVTRVVWSRDGKRLVAAGGSFDPSIYVWDVVAEKVLHRLAGHKTYVDGVALSPDEKWLASASRDGTVRLWDLTTGREVKQLEGAGGTCSCVAFSPDGRTLAAGDAQGVTRWELPSARLLRRLEGAQSPVTHVTFLRGGRTLVTGGPVSFSMWELLTEQEHHQTGDPSRTTDCLAVDPGGRRVVSAVHAGMVFLWDPTGLQGQDRKVMRLDEAELERRWEHLARGPVEAYEAIWKLSVVPGQALPLFEKHLRPVRDGSAKQIANWVVDLESDRFKVRDQAMRELEQVGDVAEGELQRALKKTRSLDAQRRIEHLLAGAKLPRDPEHLRQLRMVEALEIIGSAEARKLLQRLAGGFPEARLTREARTALERMKQ